MNIADERLQGTTPRDYTGHVAIDFKTAVRGYVVRHIPAQGRNFLLDVIGSREEGLKQIFYRASEHSSLIIEHVQRYGDFDGFFTRENVAGLTHAAGVEEELLELQAGASGSPEARH